jgi:molybdate transport system regulatory protein
MTAIRGGGADLAMKRRRTMKISARNVLEGTVQAVTKGSVNSEVTVALAGGESVVSIITNSSVDSLGLAEGLAACAIVKASEVIVGKDVDAAKLSARNVLPGTVSSVQDGAVNSEVEIALAGGATLVASITKESVQRLGLQQGDPVSAIVKASNVMIGVEEAAAVEVAPDAPQTEAASTDEAPPEDAAPQASAA